MKKFLIIAITTVIIILIIIACLFLYEYHKEKTYICEKEEYLFENYQYIETEFLCKNNNIKFPVNVQSKTVYSNEEKAIIGYNVTKAIETIQNVNLSGKIVRWELPLNETDDSEKECDKYIKSLEENGNKCKIK